MRISGAIEQATKRAAMRAHRAAMRKAMLRTRHGARTLLDAVEALAADPETPAEVRIAWGDVSEFIRSHSDVALWSVPLGLSDADLDALFRLAMQIEDE